MSRRAEKIGGPAGTEGGACSICGKPQEARYRPFCSKRCADIDLHKWLSGGYAIPGDSEEEPAADEGDANG